MDKLKGTVKALDDAVEYLNPLDEILAPFFDNDTEDFYLVKYHIEKLKNDMKTISEVTKHYIETGKITKGDE